MYIYIFFYLLVLDVCDFEAAIPSFISCFLFSQGISILEFCFWLLLSETEECNQCYRLVRRSVVFFNAWIPRIPSVWEQLIIQPVFCQRLCLNSVSVWFHLVLMDLCLTWGMLANLAHVFWLLLSRWSLT